MKEKKGRSDILDQPSCKLGFAVIRSFLPAPRLLPTTRLVSLPLRLSYGMSYSTVSDELFPLAS